MQKTEKDTIDGSRAAAYYKYFAQYNNPYVVRKLPLERVSAKCLYSKNKEKFDKFTELFQKNGIDVLKYMKFLVFKCGKTEKDVQEVLLSRVYLSKFIDWLRVQSQYSKIYAWFMKSVENIADDCIKLGMTSASQYLQHLAESRQLAAKYVSGKISVYYLCAIQNFKDIIRKLDPVSQAEFSKISNRYDKYKMDITEAFRMHKSCQLCPIKLTDELIWSRINKQKTNNSK